MGKYVSNVCPNSYCINHTVKQRSFVAALIFCTLSTTVAHSMSAFHSFPIVIRGIVGSSESEIIEIEPPLDEDQATGASRLKPKFLDFDAGSRYEVKCCKLDGNSLCSIYANVINR